MSRVITHQSSRVGQRANAHLLVDTSPSLGLYHCGRITPFYAFGNEYYHVQLMKDGYPTNSPKTMRKAEAIDSRSRGSDLSI